MTRRDHEAMLEELALAVGRRVRELRLARPAPEGTLVSLSRRTGMSVSFLSMIENGRRLPSLGALVSLAGALEIPPANLLANEGSPGPAELVDTAPAQDALDGASPRTPANPATPAELLEPVAAFFRARGLGEREVAELLEAAKKIFD